MHVIGNGLDGAAGGFQVRADAADLNVDFVAKGVIQKGLAVFCAEHKVNVEFGEGLAHAAILPVPISGHDVFCGHTQGVALCTQPWAGILHPFRAKKETTAKSRNPKRETLNHLRFQPLLRSTTNICPIHRAHSVKYIFYG